MKRCVFTVLMALLAFKSISPASADMDFTTITLGSSPNVVQDMLSENKFMFSRFSEKKFTARKIIIAPTSEGVPTGTEYPDVYPSTEVNGSFCSGKLFRLDVTSHYIGPMNLFQGRKQIYSYIKNNDGVFDKLGLSQKKEDPNVGFSFIIDRSGGGGSVKGEEKITVLLDATDDRYLKMRYRLENKWFCPE